MGKTRLNISLDQDLADFVKDIASENRVSVTMLFTQYLLELKRKVEKQDTEKVIVYPAFKDDMEEAQAKLRMGITKWHSYKEVF